MCEIKRAAFTVMRSSLSSKLEPSFLQEIVGSGCPRGGWHSRTAGSPTATITSTGFCLNSSRKTGKKQTSRTENREDFNDVKRVNTSSYHWCLQVGLCLVCQKVYFNDFCDVALTAIIFKVQIL